MGDRLTQCPECGSEKATTIRLPKHGAPGEPPSTRPAWRCLECDAQWARDAVDGPQTRDR